MWEKVWRWADVKRSRCEDGQMWEKMWRWADVKMSRCERRCERRCEDEQLWEKMWRWADVRADVREDVKMSRCENEKVWEKVWRWEGVKIRRWDTDPHYWKNPALRRSREKIVIEQTFTSPSANSFIPLDIPYKCEFLFQCPKIIPKVDPWYWTLKTLNRPYIYCIILYYTILHCIILYYII